MKIALSAAALAVIVGLGALVLWQHGQLNRLSADRMRLADQAAETARLQEELQRATSAPKSNEDRPQVDRVELMRLRAQAAKVQELEREISRLKGTRPTSTNRSALAQSNQASATSKPSDAQETETPPPPAEIVELGVVEFTEGVPRVIDIGEGGQCLITAIALPTGQYRLSVIFENEVEGRRLRTEQTATTTPGTRIVQVISGREVAMSPVVKVK